LRFLLFSDEVPGDPVRLFDSNVGTADGLELLALCGLIGREADPAQVYVELPLAKIRLHIAGGRSCVHPKRFEHPILILNWHDVRSRTRQK